jgi:hypothetical protein
MTLPEIRKQISIFLPLSDWRRLRAEAIRQRRPMTELCRRWMEPGLEQLRRREGPGGEPPRLARRA